MQHGRKGDEMTNKNPEALRLAEFFETDSSSTFAEFRAAAELRRLHEVNAELLDALKEIAAPNEFNSDHRVEAFREALREIARAAITKAEVTK
jgi:hypothetical protein